MQRADSHDCAPRAPPSIGCAIVMQKKSQRLVQFGITEQTRDAVAAWITVTRLKPEQFLFPSRVAYSPHLSTRQYSRIVGSWVGSIGLDPAAYGTHSMRRTKPTLIYRRTRTCGRYNFCSATANVRAPSDTLGSRSTMRWRSRSRGGLSQAGPVATAEPHGRRPASCSHSQVTWLFL